MVDESKNKKRRKYISVEYLVIFVLVFKWTVIDKEIRGLSGMKLGIVTMRTIHVKSPPSEKITAKEISFHCSFP